MACSVITVYVNWTDGEILGAADKEEWVEEAAEKYIEDETFFEDWLTDNYYSRELLNMTDDDKDKLLDDYREYCRNWVLGKFELRFDEKEIKIE